MSWGEIGLEEFGRLSDDIQRRQSLEFTHFLTAFVDMSYFMGRLLKMVKFIFYR